MFLETPDSNKQKKGWIEVICGSMFSGKTEELIRRLKRLDFANKKYKLFKPVVDNRYDNNKVVSHNMNSVQATIISKRLLENELFACLLLVSRI
jgi:thymidine kinase